MCQTALVSKEFERTFYFKAASAKVMSGALLGPTGYKATKDNVVSLQMSPDLIGSPFYPNNEPGP